jgi:hypothetical protein
MVEIVEIPRASSLDEVHCWIVTRSVPFRAIDPAQPNFGFILNSKIANDCERRLSYNQNEKSDLLRLLSELTGSQQRKISRKPLSNGGSTCGTCKDHRASDRRPPAKKNGLNERWWEEEIRRRESESDSRVATGV